MIRSRIIWVLCLILSLISITFYGGSISYGFFFCVAAIPVISFLYLLYVYVCFRIYQSTGGGDFVVNDAMPYSFRLINEFPIPFVSIRVRFFEPFSTINDLSDKIEYELMPKTGITRETTLVCHYRGEYEIGIKEVEVYDYFRLFKIRYKNKESRRVSVDPMLVRLNSLGNFDMHEMDAATKASKPDVLTREYSSGDDVRFVNWSQTARTGKLMVREQTGEEGNGVSIIMDTERFSEDMLEYLPLENKILELTLAISLFFCDKGIGFSEYHFYKNLVSHDIDSTLKFDGYYKAMSKVGFDQSNTQKRLWLEVSKNEKILQSSIVYMVLSGWSEEAAAMIERLSGRNIHTVIYFVSNKEIKPDIARMDLVSVFNISPADKLEEVIG